MSCSDPAVGCGPPRSSAPFAGPWQRGAELPPLHRTWSSNSWVRQWSCLLVPGICWWPAVQENDFLSESLVRCVLGFRWLPSESTDASSGWLQRWWSSALMWWCEGSFLRAWLEFLCASGSSWNTRFAFGNFFSPRVGLERDLYMTVLSSAWQDLGVSSNGRLAFPEALQVADVFPCCTNCVWLLRVEMFYLNCGLCGQRSNVLVGLESLCHVNSQNRCYRSSFWL